MYIKILQAVVILNPYKFQKLLQTSRIGKPDSPLGLKFVSSLDSTSSSASGLYYVVCDRLLTLTARMQNKVQRPPKFKSLAKRHNLCGLTDVPTEKQFKDFPINIPGWQLREEVNAKVL